MTTMTLYPKIKSKNWKCKSQVFAIDVRFPHKHTSVWIVTYGVLSMFTNNYKMFLVHRHDNIYSATPTFQHCIICAARRLPEGLGAWCWGGKHSSQVGLKLISLGKRFRCLHSEYKRPLTYLDYVGVSLDVFGASTLH